MNKCCGNLADYRWAKKNLVLNKKEFTQKTSKP